MHLTMAAWLIVVTAYQQHSGHIIILQQVNCLVYIARPVCFGLILCVPVNNYGHVGTVSSPNQTFSWASLTKQLDCTLCTYFAYN